VGLDGVMVAGVVADERAVLPDDEPEVLPEDEPDALPDDDPEVAGSVGVVADELPEVEIVEALPAANWTAWAPSFTLNQPAKPMVAPALRTSAAVRAPFAA